MQIFSVLYIDIFIYYLILYNVYYLYYLKILILII